MHVGHGLHRRRLLPQQRRQAGDAGRALERHRLDRPVHPQSDRGAGSRLQGVSCTSATACTAVGSYYNSAGERVTLAERWNGTGWKIQSTPNPTGGQHNSLQGISCTSATACTAVGNYVNSAGKLVTLAERWNGTAWTVQSTPNPSGAGGSYLKGVSCTSATACTAVGYSDQDSASRR